MLNFNKALLPSSFEVVVSDSNYEFTVGITDSECYNSLDSFASECFRQIVMEAHANGMSRKEFTDEMIDVYNKQVIEQFTKLCLIHDIDFLSVISLELKSFSRYYAEELVSLEELVHLRLNTNTIGVNNHFIDTVMEKRLRGSFLMWVDDSPLKTTSTFNGDIEITLSFGIIVDSESLEQATDIIKSITYDISNSLASEGREQIRRILTCDYSDEEISCDLNDWKGDVENIYED